MSNSKTILLLEGILQLVNRGYGIPFTVNGYQLNGSPIQGKFRFNLDSHRDKVFNWTIFSLRKLNSDHDEFRWRLCSKETSQAGWDSKEDGISISFKWAMRRIISRAAKMMGWTYQFTKEVVSEQEALLILARLGNHNVNNSPSTNSNVRRWSGCFGTLDT
jgi:hypothetical protein